ncbi:MAG: hypothetical protein IKN38_09430 [Clostridia bacterium]|nr:hypothetical protein [Clostridia bacterium]
MKIIKSLFALLLALSMLISLPLTVSAKDEYTERDVNVYRKSLDENGTVKCRFYGDIPDIPYIDYNLFLETFAEDSVDITPEGGGAKHSACRRTLL